MGDVMRKYLDDALLVIGCALMVYGAYLIRPSAGWILAGFLCMVAGILVGLGGKK
jgi:hypothetical protein